MEEEGKETPDIQEPLDLEFIVRKFAADREGWKRNKKTRQKRYKWSGLSVENKGRMNSPNF